MFAKKRHQEKALMKKTIAMHEEKEQKHKADDGAPQNAVPAYLLERDQVRVGVECILVLGASCMCIGGGGLDVGVGRPLCIRFAGNKSCAAPGRMPAYLRSWL